MSTIFSSLGRFLRRCVVFVVLAIVVDVVDRVDVDVVVDVVDRVVVAVVADAVVVDVDDVLINFLASDSSLNSQFFQF